MTGPRVDAEQVTHLVSMTEAIDAVRDAFIGLERGDFEMPPRLHLRGGEVLSMACHHKPSGSAIVKVLDLNFQRSPAILGTVLWSRRESSAQLALDAGAVTALRTGAVTGVATDLLAPPGAARGAIIGTGGQARGQVRAVHAVRPLRSLAVADTDRVKAERFASDMAEELGIADVTICTTAQEAVQGAQIVCCATTSREPLFELADLAQAVHVNAIGAYRPDMRELSDDVLASGLLVVDDIESILEESGEVIHAVASGTIGIEDLVPLGRALTVGVARTPRTIFKTVGVAVQDWAIAALVASKTAAS